MVSRLKPRSAKSFTFLLAFFFFTSTSNAANFTASISQNEVSEGDNLTLTLKLSDATAKDNPDTSEIGKIFKILGQQQSSSTLIENGKYSYSKSWGYIISPRKDGEQAIPSIYIETDAGTLHTDPITIEVGKAAQLPKQDPDKNIVISATVNKQSPYKNEPVIYTIQLISKSSLSNVTLGQVSVPNAIVEPQGEPKIMDRVQNGIPIKAIQQQYVITPLKDGQVIIPSIIMRGNAATAKTSVSNQSGIIQGFGGFDPFAAFTSFEPFALSTSEIALDVKKPEAAMDPWLPSSSVTISENLDTSGGAKVGEPLTRKFIITANGEVGSQIPSLESQQATGDDFKVYTDKPIIKDEVTTDRIIGKREETYTLIPQKPGELIMQEISLPWWDTRNNQVAYTKIPARTIKVAPGTLDKNQSHTEKNNQEKTQPKIDNERQAQAEEKHVGKNDIILYSIIAILSLILAFTALILINLQKKLTRLKNADVLFTKQKTMEEKKQKPGHKDIFYLKTANDVKIFIQKYAYANWGAPENSSLETIFILRPDIESKQFISSLNSALYAGKNIDITKLKQQLNDIIIAAEKKIKKGKKPGEKLPVLNPS